MLPAQICHWRAMQGPLPMIHRLRSCNASKAPLHVKIASNGQTPISAGGSRYQNPLPALSRGSWQDHRIHQKLNYSPPFESHIGGRIMDARPVENNNVGVSRMLRPRDRDGAVFCLTGSEYYWSSNFVSGLDDRVSCWIRREAHEAG